MRTDAQLIQLTVGDPDFAEFDREPQHDEGSFRYYRVTLRGPRYRGFPDEWQFAVHSQPEKRGERAGQEQVLEEARQLVQKLVGSDSAQEPPLVLISDDPDVSLSNRLRYQDKKVFFIDEARLRPGRPEMQTLRFTPLVAAVRNKLNADELSTLLFVPYEEPGQPAKGWRFFGRKGELDKLVNSSGNFFVLGVRRIGKTSLLQEAARRLKKQGRKVVFIPCQNRRTPPEVIDALLRELDASTMYQVSRRAKQVTEHLGDSILSNVLRQLVRDHPGTVLIFDEVGNAINENPKDDWLFAGTLREYSQNYDLRVIMSGWQEFTLKWGEFEGPFVNFGSSIRLRGFEDAEVEEFVIDALGAWGHVSDKRALRRLVTSRVGRHPLLLLYFGSALFHRLLDERAGDRDVLEIANTLLTVELQETFASAVAEVFYSNMPSRILRYLFLLRCHEAETAQQRVMDAEVSIEWIDEALTRIGYSSSSDQRRMMLEDLEMHGLVEPTGNMRVQYKIVAPVIYDCIHQMYGAEAEIELLRAELRRYPERLPLADVGAHAK